MDSPFYEYQKELVKPYISGPILKGLVLRVSIPLIERQNVFCCTIIPVPPRDDIQENTH